MCEQSSPEKGLCFSDEYFRFILELKKFNFAHIYNHWRLKEFAHYATNIIQTLYNTLMRTYDYACHGRVAQALRYYPSLCKTFEDWLIKHAHYMPVAYSRGANGPSRIDRRKILRYNTEKVFNIEDFNSFSKCVIEYISGMTDVYAIRVYEEIISF